MGHGKDKEPGFEKKFGIKAEHLCFSYPIGNGNGIINGSGKEKQVLQDIHFHVADKESVGLIGANGVGKSTLLKLLVGLANGYGGVLRVGGLDVEKKNLAAIRKSTGYVFQDSDSQLFLSTVYEDVAFGPRNYGYSGEEVERRVAEALKQVHMEELRDRQIYRMSGGQKKLASLATILSMEPQLMLLDEPSAALDPRNRRNLIHILNEIAVTKVIASHDLDFILDTCERTLLLFDGKIVRDGKTEEILEDRKLLEESGLELPLSLKGQNNNQKKENGIGSKGDFGAGKGGTHYRGGSGKVF